MTRHIFWDCFTPSDEVINHKVFHGWGGLKQRTKSLDYTLALDLSQHLGFLKYSHDKGHENKSYGKRNKSSDCCAITKDSPQCQNTHAREQRLYCLITLLGESRQIFLKTCTSAIHVKWGSQENLAQPVMLNSHSQNNTSLIRSGSVLKRWVWILMTGQNHWCSKRKKKAWTLKE